MSRRNIMSSRLLPFLALARVPLLCAALAAPLLAKPALADDAVITVKLDQARVLSVPKDVKMLIVGNPLIADVTLLKSGTNMVITGKSFGATNMIALDGAGNSLGETMIKVDPSTGERLLVQRGDARETYFCNPKCLPTVALGDDSKFAGGVLSAIASRNNASNPASSNNSGGGSH